MLLDRTFVPQDKQIIYHYCSADSFEKIVRSKALRFSDANMLNDSEELRWGYRLFEDAATDILRNPKHPDIAGLNLDFIDAIDKCVAPLQLQLCQFVCCLSQEGDQLSQWRAYADDGRGFAIGFDARAVVAMPATLMEIQYDRTLQLKEMKVALASIYLGFVKRGSKFDNDFVQDCLLLGMFFCGFKNPSFFEEREIRALRAISVNIEPEAIRFIDDDRREIGFRTSGGSIVAYVDLPFTDLLGCNSIAEVVLGPKNPNMPNNVTIFMSHLNHKNIRVRRSSCPYR
jgi:hypothetical protein